jgi:hypothetical protein
MRSVSPAGQVMARSRTLILNARPREEALAPRDPGPAHDLAAATEDVVDERGVYVTAVDEEQFG